MVLGSEYWHDYFQGNMDSFIFTVLLLLTTGGVAAQGQLEPVSAAVLRGSDARFNCSLTNPAWTVITWILSRGVVLTISKDHGVLESNGEPFTAVNYTTAESYKWELIIKNVNRNDSGEVICDIQNIHRITSVLSVQESGTVEVSGPNVAVREGEQATFHCRTSGWFPAPQISWALNGTAVGGGSYDSEAAGTLFNANSTLNISAVSSVSVECRASVPALATPQSSSVFLIVEETVTGPRDHTVLIAVVVSFGAAALLVLLIIAIIFCCRRRRATKSSYEEEVRRTQSQSERTGPGEGKDNCGYVTDGHKSDTNSDSNDSGFIQTNYTNSFEIPDVVNNKQTANGPVQAFNTLGGNGIHKHRHATIV